MAKLIPSTFVSLLAAIQLTFTPSATADSAFVMIDDVAAVEAECLPHNSVWSRRTDKTGFTGTAWLQYVGPERHGEEIEGSFNDPDGRYQGTAADWLKVPVYITKVGAYYVQIHAYHTVPCCGFADGDATVWTHAVDYPMPVRFSHGETAGGADKFHFMGYGPLSYNAEEDLVTGPVSFYIREVPQVVTFYVSGRDRYFGVDRIHVYRRIGPDNLKRGCYPANATSTAAPLSSKTVIAATSLRPVAASAPPLHSASTGASRRFTGMRPIIVSMKGTRAFDLRGVLVQQSAGGSDAAGGWRSLKR